MRIPFEVRNVDNDSWQDADILAYHSFFTCLCSYVEEEMGGKEGLEEHIDLTRQDCVKLWEEFEQIRNKFDDKLEQYMDSRLTPFEKTLELYLWYTQRDWEKGFIGTDENLKELSNKLKEAADVMWCWWV